MVERRSIIFSKLLEGLALSAAAAVAVAGLSSLTAEATPEVGIPAKRPAAAVPAVALGRGGSVALGAGILLSARGWGWFCCCCGCPGT